MRRFTTTSINNARRSLYRIQPNQLNPINPINPIIETSINDKNSIIKNYHPVSNILRNSTLIIERKIEYMNLFLGFEQSNKYAVYNESGQQIAWLIERDFGFWKLILRQIYKLHRPFKVDLIDLEGNLLMTIDRPFSFINSHIKSYLPDMETMIGESVQSWHLWRRRYNLFKLDNNNNNNEYEDNELIQFAKIDSGFLRWEFPLYDKNGLITGEVSRNFGGLFREALTDTGVYILRMDGNSFPNGESSYGEINRDGLSFDERAVLLSNAVSIDFDYFSRHSGGPGFLMFGGGGDDI